MQCLATIAYYCGLEDILSLQKDALFNNRVLYFQRLSVIGADVLYVSIRLLLLFISLRLLLFSDAERRDETEVPFTEAPLAPPD